MKRKTIAEVAAEQLELQRRMGNLQLDVERVQMNCGDQAARILKLEKVLHACLGKEFKDIAPENSPGQFIDLMRKASEFMQSQAVRDISQYTTTVQNRLDLISAELEEEQKVTCEFEIILRGMEKKLRQLPVKTLNKKMAEIYARLAELEKQECARSALAVQEPPKSYMEYVPCAPPLPPRSAWDIITGWFFK